MLFFQTHLSSFDALSRHLEKFWAFSEILFSPLYWVLIFPMFFRNDTDDSLHYATSAVRISDRYNVACFLILFTPFSQLTGNVLAIFRSPRMFQQSETTHSEDQHGSCCAWSRIRSWPVYDYSIMLHRREQLCRKNDYWEKSSGCVTFWG